MPELPTDDHAPRRLAKLRICDLREKTLLRLGEIDAVDVIDQIGGAKIGQLGLGKLDRNIGKRKGLPVACEQFVRQVGSRQLFQSIELQTYKRIHPVKARIDLLQLVDKDERLLQGGFRHRAG